MRIYTKAVLVGIPLAVFSATSIIYFSRDAVRRLLIRELVESVAVDVKEQFEPLSAVFSRDNENLLKSIQTLKEHVEAVSVAAINTEGEVLAHTDVSEIGKIYQDPLTLRALQKFQKRPVQEIRKTPPAILIAVPIQGTAAHSAGEEFLFVEKDGPTVGLLKITVPLKRLLRTENQISRNVFWIVVTTFGIVIVFVLIMLKQILRRVQSLAVAARRIGEGHFGELLPIKAKDEVGELAETFNQMSDMLASTVVSKDYVNAILTSMLDPLLVADMNGNVRMSNKALRELLGYNGEEITGRPVASLFFGTPMGIFRGEAKLGPEASQSFRSRDLELLTKDGKRIPVLFSSALMRDGEGKAVGHVGVAKDITELKKAQEAVAKNEWKLKKSLEGADYGIWDLDLTSGKFGFSDSLNSVLGYAPGELVLDIESWKTIIHPDDRSWVVEHLKSYLREKQKTYLAEYRVRTKVGGWKWVLVRGQVGLFAEDGNPIHLFGAFEDMTARREAEEARTRLSQVVEQAVESVVITDLEGKILYVNQAFEEISGYKREELLGRNPRIVKSGRHDRAFYEEMWKTLGRGETWRGRVTNKSKDGKIFEEESIISPVRDGAGKIVSYAAVKRDVTKQMELEQQLMQSQKMEAIGRLAGGVAHDFNNLLTSILGFAQMALDQAGSESPMAGDIKEIVSAGERAAALTQQLLAFSRRQVAEPKVLDLCTVVADTEKLLKRMIGEDVKLVITKSPERWNVKIDPNQFGQILMNLAVNARDAMPKGGTLAIKVNIEKVDQKMSYRHEQIMPGEYVIVSVSDTGKGMSEDVQEHLFEPFFTTKPKGQGTGLGLATVYGIIKQNKGFVTVYSEVDKGTTIRIYLPRYAEAEKHPVAEEAPAGETNGSETVLLVEDERMVRSMARKSLESRGYKIISCESGREAMAVLQRETGTIHLLLTDVVMPDMSGPELAEKVRSLRRNIKVLYMSGYTNEMIAAHGMLEEGMHFIQKPFTPSVLAKKVREVLG